MLKKCVQAVSYFPEEISFQLHIVLVVFGQVRGRGSALLSRLLE
jgi:hypothetical protein